MTNICWICEKNNADSCEHRILKSALNTIIGKPIRGESRYVTYIAGPQNVPVSSFKNNRFKFEKSICKHCNNALTQPYDDAFRFFINSLLKSKKITIARNKVSIPQNSQNLALYFLKIFGCLIVERKASIEESDYQLFRHSLLHGSVITNNVFLCMHRDLCKLSAKTSATVGQNSVVEKDFIAWTIDLDWISLVLSYPFPPPKKYGTSWKLGSEIATLKLGKLQ